MTGRKTCTAQADGPLGRHGMSFVHWTPRAMRRADRHNEVELNLLRSGSLTYLLGGRRVVLPAGRLAVFWAAVPHQVVEVTTREPYYVATVPLIWFLQRQLAGPVVHRILTGGVLMDTPGRGESDLALFEQWVADAATADPQKRRVVLLELEARLLRLAAACGPGRRAAPPAATEPVDRVRHVERMLAVIAAGYAGRLTVDDIVRPTGLHANYAMALFKRLFGMTFVDCVTRHRLTHAQRLLATTDLSIAALAQHAGFRSLSRFNDAFKRLCGCTPRQYRTRHALP